jgi:membrane protein YfhO
MVVFSSIVEGLYLVFRTPSFELGRQLLFYGTAKLLGVLTASLQLLPTWDVVSNSYRAELPAEARYWWSLHPANLVQLVGPYLFLTRVVGGNTHEFGLYNGAVVTVSLLWLVIRFKALGSKRYLVMGAFVLGGLGLILAMGKHGYLYRIFAQLPISSLVRVPARYILLLHFAMGVAGAVAFIDIANLVHRGDRLKWRKLWPLTLIPVASVLAAGFALWARAHADSDFWVVHELAVRVASPGYVLIGPVLLTLGTAIFIAAARGIRYVLAGIVLFTMADQAIYGLSYVWSAPRPVDIATFVSSQPLPPELTSHRVQFYNVYYNLDYYNNGPTMNGIQLAGGYAALSPEFRLDSMNHSRLRLAGVRWFQTPDMQWSQVERPLPRARLVSQELVSLFPNKDIDGIDVETTALVAEPLNLAGGQPGAASIVSDRPGKIKLTTTATSRQLLVLSESYHEGWKATVDAHVCSVLRVYGDFMGCVVEAGVHDVEFSFEPLSLRFGGWLSALGLSLTVLFLVISLSQSAPAERLKNCGP